MRKKLLLLLGLTCAVFASLIVGTLSSYAKETSFEMTVSPYVQNHSK